MTGTDRRPSLLRRARPTVLGILAFALVLEIAAWIVTPVANRVLPDPIMTRGEIYAGQTAALRTLLAAEGRERIDPDLGWRYEPGWAEGPDTISLDGLRSGRAYDLVPPAAETRVAAFGDSFVYCVEVANPECWTARVEDGWKAEVLNYGVGGYGTDQAWLRYRKEGTRFSPEIVLIGFAPVNLRRAANRYRRFISPRDGPWFKPRFLVEGEELVLLPSPVADPDDARALIEDPTAITLVGEADVWYEPTIYEHPLYRVSAAYRLVTQAWILAKRRNLGPERLYEDEHFRTETESFAVQLRVLEAFAASVREDGARPVVLLLPDRHAVEQALRGEEPSYQPLVDALSERGVPMIDLVEALSTHTGPVDELFMPGGHYSPPANRLVAGFLAETLDLAERGTS